MHKKFLKSMWTLSVFLFFSNQAYSEGRFQLNAADPFLSAWQVFDEGTIDTPSAWSSANGTIDQSSNIYGGGAGNQPDKPGTMAISGNPEWSDYRFTLALLSRDDDAIGVIFRYQDPKNYYRYSMDKQRNVARVVKFVNGTLSVLAEIPFAYNKNQWYGLSVEGTGSTFQVLLNGKPILTVNDPTFSKGKVGLYCWGNKGASFKEISVTPIENLVTAASLKGPAVGTTLLPTPVPALSSAPALETGSASIPPPKGSSSDLETLAQEVELLKKEVRSLREEAEIRRQLQMTEDEKSEAEEELLTAAGREYTLLRKGVLGFEYSMSYAYYSYDSLDSIDGALTVSTFSNHNLTHTLFTEYALLDNLTLTLDIPYAFKHYNEDNTSRSVNDIGDLRVGFQFQPVKARADRPAFILTSSLSCPTGRSPYEIDPNKGPATGNGIYALSGGMSASKTIDPIMTFGSVGYSYNFTQGGLDYKYGTQTIREVDSGDYASVSAGFAYALSYMVSLNMSYQFIYAMESSYHFKEEASKSQTIQSGVSSLLSIGMGFRIKKTKTLITSIAMGLTNDDPDFLVSVRVPFEFNLIQ